MDAHEPDRASEKSNDGTNRHGRSRSSWGLSSTVHAVHGMGFMAKKVINNRLTDSLWHSKKSSSSASGPSDASDPKQENHSHEPINHHTSQPSLNVDDEQPTHERANCNTIGSDVIDQLENLKPQDADEQSEDPKPTDGSHVKPIKQHRWSRTVGSNVLNKSINHLYEASRVPKLHRKAFPKHASKSLQDSSIDATNLPSSSVLDDATLKNDEVIESHSSSPNKSHVLASRDVNPTTIGVSPTPTRGADPTPTRGVSPTPTRGADPTPTRGVNPTPTRGAGTTPTRGVSPTPTRGADTTPTRGVSPTPTRGVGHRVRDVSPTSVKPSKSSGRRHFFTANILSVFTKIVDNRKEKHVDDPKEVAKHLELLYNIQVQWQFANASAEAALVIQRETAEKSLLDVWRAISALRDSIASMKIDVALLILQLKLYAVLHRQMAYMDEWASIQKEHESALFATTNDLQARSLSVPITGGVKADIKGLRLIVFSTIHVLQATLSCIQSMLSKLDKTHFLASEVANLALHERALLDECEIFLAASAPLHIEECSLRSYLMQFNRNSMTE